MKILLLGGSGLVGSRFIELFTSIFEIDSPSHNDLDVVNEHELQNYLSITDAEVVINLVAFTNVDAAEYETADKNGQAYILNSLLPFRLARECKQISKHLIHVSTDYVFDGTKESAPYTENDSPNPTNWYAKTKFYGEQNVLEQNPLATIARIEMPYSKNFAKKNDFARLFLQTLSQGKTLRAVNDQKITPIFLDHCVDAFRTIVENKPSGIYHIASTDWITPYIFASKIAEIKGFDNNLIQPIPFAEFNQGRKAPRPKHSWMSTEKFINEFGDKILHTNIQSIQEFLNNSS